MCIDAFDIGKLKGVGKLWQLTACDAACSYAIATVVPRVTAQAAVYFLRTHVGPIYERAGHRIRAVLTAGGPEFQTAFTATCRERGIEHRRTKPRHAWTNGFVERLQGTILSELWRVAFRRTYYTSLAQLERDLQAYLRFYNWERPHRGYRLKGRTPDVVDADADQAAALRIPRGSGVLRLIQTAYVAANNAVIHSIGYNRAGLIRYSLIRRARA